MYTLSFAPAMMPIMPKKKTTLIMNEKYHVMFVCKKKEKKKLHVNFPSSEESVFIWYLFFRRENLPLIS